MIRVNLLGVERKFVKPAGAFDAAQKITVACSAVLIVAALFVGWRYWALQQESKQLDQGAAAHHPSAGADIRTAEGPAARAGDAD